ncbi:MAG: hypothetical protein Q8930_02890 [Bacillota bacterium]|nr:hypothetical protein [Bacillota bacterium]
MKKAAVCFSLTVLLMFFVYVSLKMNDSLRQSPTNEGIAQETINKAVEKTGALDSVSAVVSDFRSFDTIGEAAVLFSTATGAVILLGKQKKAKGGK